MIPNATALLRPCPVVTLILAGGVLVGTVREIAEPDQVAIDAALTTTEPILTELEPRVAPKFSPVMVILWVALTEVGDIDPIQGEDIVMAVLTVAPWLVVS